MSLVPSTFLYKILRTVFRKTGRIARNYSVNRRKPRKLLNESV